MKCLICQKRKAVEVPPYGLMPCKKCQAKQRKLKRPGTTGEVIPERIREDRKKFKKDLTQPFKGGELTKEYVDAHPQSVKEMIKEGHVTQKEVRKAKNLWDLDYYKKE